MYLKGKQKIFHNISHGGCKYKYICFEKLINERQFLIGCGFSYCGVFGILLEVSNPLANPCEFYNKIYFLVNPVSTQKLNVYLEK